MRTRKKIKRNLEVLLARGLKRFARSLPRGAGLRIFGTFGTVAGRLLKNDRDRAMRNLEIAFPDAPAPIRRAMTGAMFRSLGQNAYEFLNLEGSSSERVRSLVEKVEGLEYLAKAYHSGQGVIAITGHIGCWELLAAYFANSGYETNVVGRELWESRLNRELIRIRESVGYRTIDRDAGGKQILSILRGGGLVAVLIDQHTRVSGIYVPFFNRPAHTPTGVARLAISTGAALVPLAIYMTRPGRHIIRILPPVEMPDEAVSRDERTEIVTRRCSLAVENLIRYDPKQWVWFHRRWRDPENAEVGYASVN